MTDQKLGKIEEVPLREVWKDEARDFTPWLVEHLDLLGEALHLDLTPVEAEGQVGTFSVDVVADTYSGVVVIENQLGKTDHTHLGQLLTYAAGRDARVLIWITPDFRDEHRAALDWLNHWTAEEIEVYGVEVRAIRIGQSLPALEFRPVAFPNSWSRGASSRTKSAPPENRERYRAFYQPLVDQAREFGLTDRTRATGVPYQHIAQSVADGNIQYVVQFRSKSKEQVSVALDIRASAVGWNRQTTPTEWNRQIHDRLQKRRVEIEADLALKIDWDKPNRGRSQGIQVFGTGSLDYPPERQDEVRRWMLDTVVALKSALDPRLQQIVEELDAEEADSVSGALSSEDL